MPNPKLPIWMDPQAQNVTTAFSKPSFDLSLNRRGFLQGLGISGAISLAACQRLPVQKAIPFLVPPENIRPGESTRYASTCSACQARCGSLVTVRDGRPIKLEGHPEHPGSQGGLCARGQAEIRGLYDSGRLKNSTLGQKVSTADEVDAALRAAIAKADKNRVYLLTRRITGPAEQRAIQTFVAATNAKWVSFDPLLLPTTSMVEAYRLLDGTPALTRADFSDTELVVSFASDFLGTGDQTVAYASSYAQARRRRASGKTFYHLQCEGTYSLTGANADKRYVLTYSERQQILLGLLRRAADDSPGPWADLARQFYNAQAPEKHALVDELYEQLRSARGKAQVLSGTAGVAEQQVVALLNRLLRNEHNALKLQNADWFTPSIQGQEQYFEALRTQQIDVLITLDINPVEELPCGAELTSAYSKLPFVAALTHRPHATAQSAHVVVATHHPLEAWGDARNSETVCSLQQPQTQPLFATRHPFETLLKWAGHAVTDFSLFLQQTWEELVLSKTNTKNWRAALAHGFVELTPTPVSPVSRHVPTVASLVRYEQGDNELELFYEVGIGDGRHSYNPWLRELPDPLAKTSWVGCARISPQRAQQLNLRDGDHLEFTTKAGRIEMPVRLSPGQHNSVVGIPLGYGVVDGDRSQTPKNAAVLLTGAPSTLVHVLGASVTSTGTHDKLPLSQIQSDTQNRPIVHQVESFQEKIDEPHHDATIWPKHDYPTTKWEMVIDLDACTGCNACVVSCQAENNIPVVGDDEMRRNRDMYWLRIDRYFSGDNNNPQVLFEPMMCAQCENAPCETVCPVAATVHSADGLNQQAYNRCVGTRYCANNCPYKVRRFNWFSYASTDPVEKLVLNPDVVVRDRGVMEKCTFCVQRLQGTRIHNKVTGQQEVPKTACQESCPTQAISFGNAADQKAPLLQLKNQPRAFTVLADLGVGPSITYLAKVRKKGEAS